MRIGLEIKRVIAVSIGRKERVWCFVELGEMFMGLDAGWLCYCLWLREKIFIDGIMLGEVYYKFEE
jgi:hypothetical protein